MQEKERKINHDAEKIFESIGLDEQQYNVMIQRAVNAFNEMGTGGSATVSMGYAAVAAEIRTEFVGEEKTELSRYELALVTAGFTLGKMQSKGAFVGKARQALSVIMLTGMLGDKDAQLELALETIKAMAMVNGGENSEGHECSKCGLCGKKFDGDGNEVKE